MSSMWKYAVVARHLERNEKIEYGGVVAADSKDDAIAKVNRYYRCYIDPEKVDIFNSECEVEQMGYDLIDLDTLSVYTHMIWGYCDD